MSSTINVTLENGEVKEFYKGIELESLANEYQKNHKYKIIAAIVNNELSELKKELMSDSKVEFIDLLNADGMRIYQRSLCLLLLSAAKKVLGKEVKILIEHSIGRSLCCNIESKDFILTEEMVQELENKMKEMVQEDIEIEKLSLPTSYAMEILKDNHLEDKINLFKYKKASVINLYKLDDYYDYFYGYMAPRTSYLDKFSLLFRENQIIINLPLKENPGTVSVFKPSEKLNQIFDEATSWNKIMNVDNVGALNDVICKGDIGNLIRVSEALHEKKLAYIADMIHRRKKVGVVLIAGPSSSGKTTFAKRLCVQLRVNGLKPYVISIDDYYLNRDDTPRKPNGEYDFECLEAIDIKQFNQDLKNLLDGKTVEIPHFNFKTGKREYKGDFITLKENEILVMEGIHGLNEKLTNSIPKENKFKIYLSALTQLNIDNHNRIPTTDTRLIRRIVRDNHFRGFKATNTMGMWKSVREGEEQNIFPYQEEADVMFNSSLIYELAVLKQYVEPLLFQIEKDDPNYKEAKRLIKFMDYFLGVPSEDIPNNSIIREFIGGSCFIK